MTSKTKTDPEREDRIAMEIVVDCHDESERAMGWFSYLDDTLTFPFAAKCKLKRAISPLEVGDVVEVIDIGPEEESSHEIFVFIRWVKSRLAVPLSQLEVPCGTDETTREAVNDWLYWAGQGHEF